MPTLLSWPAQPLYALAFMVGMLLLLSGGESAAQASEPLTWGTPQLVDHARAATGLHATVKQIALPGSLRALQTGAAAVMASTAAASQNLTIVIGQGEAGVKIGATETQVEKAIGRPGTKEHFETETVWKGFKTFRGVVSFDHHHRVSGMWTANKKLKTNKGINVESTVAQVQQAYPAAKCTLGTGPGAGPGEESETCTLKTKYHGHTVATAFQWRNNRGPMEEIDIDLVK